MVKFFFVLACIHRPRTIIMLTLIPFMQDALELQPSPKAIISLLAVIGLKRYCPE